MGEGMRGRLLVGSRRSRRVRVMLGVAATLAASTMLVGCSGYPDASGTWDLEIPVVKVFSYDDGSEEFEYKLTAELRQLEEGELEGTATADFEDGEQCNYDVVSPDMAVQAGTDASRVTEEGEIVLAFDGQCWESESYVDFALQGEIDGGEMTGEAVSPVEAGSGEGVGSRVLAGAQQQAPVYATGEGEWTAERVSE